MNKPLMNPLYTATNNETGMSAFVSTNMRKEGGFNVTLRDDDSGEYVPLAIIGISNFEDAKKAALKAADLKDTNLF